MNNIILNLSDGISDKKDKTIIRHWKCTYYLCCMTWTGLCGGFNANIIKAKSYFVKLREENKELKLSQYSKVMIN